ncbi:hypothetical protein BDZ88DRAFT_450731 [Geranomyces variabilis]|nr:hypothetical protein BDZ88DRAFT_450731 [Geranomyces variabilis]
MTAPACVHGEFRNLDAGPLLVLPPCAGCCCRLVASFQGLITRAASPTRRMHLAEDRVVKKQKGAALAGQASNKRRSLALPAGTPAYHIDAAVEIRGREQIWWPALVKQVTRGKVVCTYEGWGSEHDESIDWDSPRLRLRVDVPISRESSAPSSPPAAPTPVPDIITEQAQKPFDSATPVSQFVGFSARTAANASSRSAYIARRALSEKEDAAARALLIAGATVEVYSSGEWFPATVRKVRGHEILVHYHGWEESWDEWIDPRPAKCRFVAHPPGPEPPAAQMKKSAKVKKSGGTNWSAVWKVSCNSCHKSIDDRRYFCTYCESGSHEMWEYQSFDLCLNCFAHDFPVHHPHPASGFASQPIRDSIPLLPPDDFDTAYVATTATSSVAIAITLPPRCMFCNSETATPEQGPFVGPYPFKNPRPTVKIRDNGSRTARHAIKPSVLWTHDACARFAPETLVVNGLWYNVLKAFRRSRGMKCVACKKKGATIGCFDERCPRSYHVGCTNKPLSSFEQGVIFWCPLHESVIGLRDYEDTFACDRCEIHLGSSGDTATAASGWYTCTGCADSHFTSYDLCNSCFANDARHDHEHPMEQFVETSLTERKQKREEEKSLARAFREANTSVKALGPKNRKVEQDSLEMRCAYCWSSSETDWRKGYKNMPMCRPCFAAASTAMLLPSADPATPSFARATDTKTTESMPEAEQCATTAAYEANLGEYAHEWYWTRGSARGKGEFPQDMPATGDGSLTTITQFGMPNQPAQPLPILSSYEPEESHLYSLGHDSSFFDIPSRAPRWAVHSGSDYHGTWLPQVVRLTLQRYTVEGAKVLSNFSGRGTDAIECFLLKRRCCAVDVNPSSVALAQRNVGFPTPPSLGLTAALRPVIVRGDSRALTGALFGDETYDHVLSHPPYKDCIAYSAGLAGDLSGFHDERAFQTQMAKVANETWRLLKAKNARCTLGIGDNRRDCFYQLVSFQTMRTYLDAGFEMEEQIVKRQRFSQSAPLGTFLSTRFNFLMFTHEYVAILRKVDKPAERPFQELMRPVGDQPSIQWMSASRRVPRTPISRSSVVMGTTWTFQVSATHSLASLAMSRLVERFGTDDMPWEEVSYTAFRNEVLSTAIYHDQCAERDPPAVPDDAYDVDTQLKHSEYERKRREVVDRNEREMSARGLISGLSADGKDDSKHLATLLSAPIVTDTGIEAPCLIIIPHINVPTTALIPDGDWVARYLQFLVARASQAASRLAEGGLLIIGVKDVRVTLDVPAETSNADNTDAPLGRSKYIPLGMILSEEMAKHIETPAGQMRLRDFVVAVPDGYSRDKDAWSVEELRERVSDDLADWAEENQREADGKSDIRRLLPIVQAYYFIYVKIGSC